MQNKGDCHDVGTQFSVGSGHFIVGLGRGHGQYVQMDGATTICTATGNSALNTDTWLPKEEQVEYRVYATNSVFMLGAYGGLGECIVSNGTFVSNLRTFVGGITTNQYYDGPSLQVDLGDYDGKSRTLLSFAKKEGDFGHVSVVGANEKDYEALVRSDCIYLRANIGTVLMVR